MKYNLNEVSYSCIATYEDDELVKVVCFNKFRDTILTEDYIHSKRNGMFYLKYDNGNIKEQGKFCNDYKCGTWKEYYETGVLKNLKHFEKLEEGKDSTIIFYHKHYTNEGLIDSGTLPINYSLEPNDSLLKIGKNYALYIDLLYSEFDSIHSYIICNSVQELGIKSDTLAYIGPRALISFSPKVLGKFAITGLFMEVDAMNVTINDSLAAEKPFSFEVKVK